MIFQGLIGVYSGLTRKSHKLYSKRKSLHPKNGRRLRKIVCRIRQMTEQIVGAYGGYSLCYM